MESTLPNLGRPAFAWFGGILEGPAGDSAALVAIVKEIQALGFLRADLEIDRGRFSLVFDSSSVAGSRIGADGQDRLVEGLQRFVAACPDPLRIESTLHCTEVYDEKALETLFAMQAGQIEAVSRTRPVRPADRGREPAAAQATSLRLPNMSTAAWALLVGLFVLAGGLLAWRSGIVHRFLAAKSETIQVDTALFQDMLKVEVRGEWGDYVVGVSRGTRYPKDLAEAEALKQATQNNVEAAAVQAVVSGGRLFVQLLDKDGSVLEAKEVSLATLLTREAASGVHLPGRYNAKALRLALDAGLEKP